MIPCEGDFFFNIFHTGLVDMGSSTTAIGITT
jgi:hypothetical protein